MKTSKKLRRIHRELIVYRDVVNEILEWCPEFRRAINDAIIALEAEIGLAYALGD